MKLHLPPTLRKALLAVVMTSLATFTLQPANVLADDSGAVQSFPYIDENEDLQEEDILSGDMEFVYRYANGQTITINGDNPGSLGFGVDEDDDVLIFGGFISGDVSEIDTEINFVSGSFGYVAHYSSSATFSAIIFGGNLTGNFSGSSTFTLYSGSVGLYFGGNQSGSFEGESNIDVQGGNANILFGGNQSDSFSGDVSITVSDGNVDSIYGGSADGTFSGTTNIEISGISGSIYTVYGGSKAGFFNADSTITISGDPEIWGNLNIYLTYGGNESGTFIGNSVININGGSNNHAGTQGYVYGGSSSGTFTGSSTVNVTSCDTKGIYGGNEEGTFEGDSLIFIDMGDGLDSSDNGIGCIYGGNETGDFTGSSTIEILAYADHGSLELYGANESGSFEGDVIIDAKNAILSTIVGGNDENANDIDSYFNGTVSIKLDGVEVSTITGGSTAGDFTGSISMELIDTDVSGNIYGGCWITTMTDGDGLAEVSQGDIVITLVSGSSNSIYAAGRTSSTGGIKYSISTDSTLIDISDQFEVNGSIYGGYYLGGSGTATIGTRTINFSTENSTYDLISGIRLGDFDVIDVASGSVVTTTYKANEDSAEHSITKTGSGTWFLTDTAEFSYLLISEGGVIIDDGVSSASNETAVIEIAADASIAVAESQYTNTGLDFGLVFNDGAILSMNLSEQVNITSDAYLTLASSSSRINLVLTEDLSAGFEEMLFNSNNSTNSTSFLAGIEGGNNIELYELDNERMGIEASAVFSSVSGLDSLDGVWLVIEDGDIYLTDALRYDVRTITWAGGDGDITQSDGWIYTKNGEDTYIDFDVDYKSGNLTDGYVAGYAATFTSSSSSAVSISIPDDGVAFNSLTFKGDFNLSGGDVSVVSSLSLFQTYTDVTISGDVDAASAAYSANYFSTFKVEGDMSIDSITSTYASIGVDGDLTINGTSDNTASSMYVGGVLSSQGSIQVTSTLELGASGAHTINGNLTSKGGSSELILHNSLQVSGSCEISSIVIDCGLSSSSAILSGGSLSVSNLVITLTDDAWSSLGDGSYMLTDFDSGVSATSITLSGQESASSDVSAYEIIIDNNGNLYLSNTGVIQAKDEWISEDGIWDSTTSDWLSGSLPTASSTIYFSGDGSTSVQLDGAKTINVVNVSGADYSFTGDSLTTTSMNVDALTLTLDNDVTVTGSLKAAAADIVNSGTLTIGDGSDLQSLTGTGTLQVLSNATVAIDALSQSAVMIQSGAKLLLGSADVSLETLNNAGSLSTSGSLSLTSVTTTGGDVSVGSLAIVAGSTFGDITCASLSIDGILSTTGAMLSVSSLSGDITLDLLDFDSTIAAGTYDIITGVGSLAWDDITLSDDMQLAMENFEDAYKELEWTATNGTLQLIVTSVIPSPDDLEWVGGTGTETNPIVWDETESNWTGAPDGWEGTFIPGAGTDISFNLSDSTYISLDGAKVVEDTVLTNAGSDKVSLNLSGDALTTDSLTSTNVDITLSNTTTVKGATTLTSADLTVTDTGVLTTDSLSADASSSIDNAGITSVTGSLTAGSVTNSGVLSIGSGSDIASLTGDGVLVVLANSSAAVERMTQDGLTLQSGASLNLGSADTSAETTSVKVLTNAGSITMSNALEVETKTDVGGDVTAPALTVQSGSTFSDLLVDSLTIEGSITSGAAALTVDSLAALSADSISLDVTSFSSALDNGTYTIIAGDSSLEWADFTISQDMLDVATAIAEQDRVVQWVDSGDSLQIVILAGSPRYWSSSTDYSIMMDDGQSVDGSERSLFVSAETGEIVSYTNFQNVVGINVDANATIDLSISLAPEAGQSLQLQNMTGVAGANLSLIGSGADTHTATLLNTSATVASSGIIASSIQLNVENADGASLSLASLQLNDASLNIASGAQLILGSISDVADTVNSMVNNGTLTLQSGQAGTLELSGTGTTIIAANAVVGLGSLNQAALNLQAGSTLSVSDASSVSALSGTGTLDASTTTLTLAEDLSTSATIKADNLLVQADVNLAALTLGTGASISSADDSLIVAKLDATGASIDNAGTLELGDGSHVGTLSGDGKTIISANAAVTVDSFDSSSLTLESGSTVSINSDATLIDLVNLGTIVMENNTLTLGAAVSATSYDIMTVDASSTATATGTIIAKDLVINDDRAFDTVTVLDSLTVNTGASLSVNALNSDNENSVVTGTVQVLGAGGDYQGTYVDAVVDIADANATQNLVTGDSLALTGSAGTFVLTAGTASALKSINMDGANLDLTQLGSTSVDLSEASSLANANLSIAFDAAAFASTETAQVVFTGASMSMSNVNVVLSALDETALSQLKGLSTTEDVVLLDLGSAVSATGLDIDIEGTTLSKYIKSAAFVGSQLIVDVNTTFYEDAIVSGNGAAGMKMIASVYDAIDPQRDKTGQYADLSSAMDSIDDMLMVDNHKGVNQLAAAMSGSATTALGSAMMTEIERQLRSSNNRARMEAQPGMGGKGGSAWIAAESNFDRLGNNGTYGGHHFSSYGGSVGVDLMTGRGTSFGLSFTAMRGDLNTSTYDIGDGSLNTNFMSLYGKVVSGNWKHSYAMSFGWGSAEMERSISHANGYYNTTGRSDTHAFGALYEASYDIGEMWSLVANTSLQNSVAGAYTESGSDAGLNVGRQSSTWATFGIGVNAAMELGETAVNRTCSLNTRAIVKFYAGDTGSSTDVSLIAGGEQARVYGTEAGSVALEFAAGLVIPITNVGDDIFVEAAVQLRDEESSVNVSAGYRCSF